MDKEQEAMWELIRNSQNMQGQTPYPGLSPDWLSGQLGSCAVQNQWSGGTGSVGRFPLQNSYVYEEVAKTVLQHGMYITDVTGGIHTTMVYGPYHRYMPKWLHLYQFVLHPLYIVRGVDPIDDRVNPLSVLAKIIAAIAGGFIVAMLLIASASSVHTYLGDWLG